MELVTSQKDHWILDSVYSNPQVESKEKQIVLDSIQAIIDKNRELYEDKMDETDIDLEESNLFSKIPNLISNPTPTHKNYISKSQNWMGHVLEVSEDSFFAKLEDRNNPTTYETASFDIEEVSMGDLHLLTVGALFYWSIGYANQNGQVTKQSLVRFKRAVELTEDEFESITERVDKLYDDLNWD